MTAGARIPLTQVYVVAQGRCVGASSCSSTFYMRDRVTSSDIGSCTYTFGSSWTIQGGPSSSPCLINFANVPAGDALGWDTNSWTASGLTAVDVSFVGFQPQNTDVVSEMLSSVQLAGVIQSGAAGAPLNITAANWRWNNVPGVPDGSSPVGYSTALGNAWSLSAWNGSTNLNGGALYPAVPSTISYLVQAPAVLTNTLAATIAATDTSLTVNVPATSSWASGGCFQIDQEIVCYSGTLTNGSTSIPVSRGQYGTLPQAHASGATLSSVGTGVFYAVCNSTNYAVTNVVFGSNWSYVSSPFAAQNCSGTSTSIHLSFANGPVGQTYKIAAVQIAQNSGNPPANSANQVPVSANAGNSQYGWTGTKSLAGSGAAIPTGPAASTSGNITTFTGGNGQLQDSGVSLGSLASLSSPAQQTFAGGISTPNVNGVVYANPNASGTTTAGINEAFDSFGAAPNCGTVVLPLGTYSISSTIGGTHVQGRNGCILRGHGMTDAGVGAATAFKWTGAANGTMLDMLNCYYCRTEKFLLNGNGTAGIGHATEAENGSSHFSFGNVIEDVNVEGIGGTPGIAFDLFSTNNVMVDQTTFKHVVAGASATCFDLSGANTTDTQVYGQSNCNASTYGFNLGTGTGLTLDGVEFSEYGSSHASIIFNVAHQASVSASNIYSEAFGQVLVAPGVTNALDYGISIKNSAFNEQAWGNSTIVNYTQNGMLDFTGTGFRSNLTTGAQIVFNPVGTPGYGTLGLLNLTNAGLTSYVTVNNLGASSGAGSLYTLGNTVGGPVGGLSWYPRDTIGGLAASIFDGLPIHMIGGSPVCYQDQLNTAGQYYCEYAHNYSGSTQLAWYQGATVLGGWNILNSLTAGTFAAYNFEVFNNVQNPSGQVLLKASLTGYHGTSGTKVQYSDGTGATGDLASYASDGSVTDSGVKPYLKGTTGSIGGTSLTAGTCTSGTVSVANATTSMAVVASPATYPGDAFDWRAYVSAAGTVTVKVCAVVAGTPTAGAYNVRVIQ
jgi:hypothetical protein